MILQMFSKLSPNQKKSYLCGMKLTANSFEISSNLFNSLES